MGFTTPTPVQVQAIPLAMNKRDVLASAQTGTARLALSVFLLLRN